MRKHASIQSEPPEWPSLEAGALAHGSRRAVCVLTANGRVILEKPIVFGLVKNFQKTYAILTIYYRGLNCPPLHRNPIHIINI